MSERPHELACPGLDGDTKILRIRINHANAGLFAHLTFVLNQIQYAEREGLLPVVHFGPESGPDPVDPTGLNPFYDESHGANVWDYYFEPVAGITWADVDRAIADPDSPVSSQQVVALDDEALWALHLDDPASIFNFPYGRQRGVARSGAPEGWYQEQRARARELIRRYVRVKPHVLEKVERFRADHLEGHHVLGIHLRGTDKGNRDARTGTVVAEYAPVNLTRIVPPEEYFFYIDAYLEQRPEARLFVATDQAEYLAVLRRRYGDRVLARDCERGQGHGIGANPFQIRDGEGYRKGEEVLVDGLLLSGCDFLLKCTSAVGEYATYFSDGLQCFDLNHHAPGSFPFGGSRRGGTGLEAGEKPVGVVVNYFSKDPSGEAHDLIVESTGLSLRLLKLTPSVGTVLLVDGSPKCDEGIRNRCQELDVEYFHAGRETSYVESYNLGWRSLAEDHEYVGLMANDVLPHPTETIGRLRDQLALPDVGCTFPYLLTARQQEDETQRPGFLGRSRVTCEPASMTLNLNLFRREVLEAIGGLDEAYRGGYGEPILMLAIRKLGYRVVMVGGTQAYHYDRLTKLLGASSINDAAHDADSERWFRDYGKYASRRGIANLDFSRWPFATTTLARWMWRICYRLPGRKARKRVMRYGMWLEPFLTRYPARYGAKRR